jgi:hypothetical protein
MWQVKNKQKYRFNCPEIQQQNHQRNFEFPLGAKLPDQRDNWIVVIFEASPRNLFPENAFKIPNRH